GAAPLVPSFPTRRSSDLLEAVGLERLPRERPGLAQEQGVAAAAGGDDGQLGDRALTLHPTRPGTCPAARRRPRSGCSRDGTARPDRKSTRLNSSHVKISY